MKVIKVGTSSQTRIAQACDRCRSKKIRCDGIRPCCSQCANVGFECKTSDKLSRRAFPRGYTESLEERVRSLEAEVRDLKDQLDEKDERIDLLASGHASSCTSQSPPSSTPTAEGRPDSPLKEDGIHVQTSPSLSGSEISDSLFVGDSSGKAFVNFLKRKFRGSDKSCPDFNTEAFLGVQAASSILSARPVLEIAHPLPRLFSDRCVQIFFQEWAPLFPVLHRPSFLSIYEKYVSDPKMSHSELVQLHLVFGIAALSSNMAEKDHIDFCEDRWRASLDAMPGDNALPPTLQTLQNYVLALLYTILKGNCQALQRRYRELAVRLSHRLGLHQSQKCFSLSILNAETRKKVFWTLYTVECFSSALLGVPRLLAKENDIQCEYPTAIDDDYVVEDGFLPSPSRDSSTISTALSLFRVSRILSSVLQNYTTASRENTLQSLISLEAELNEWADGLPPHLNFNFEQDKQLANVTSSRSALLSLSYHFIFSMIHRCAVGSSLGSRVPRTIASLADSSRLIIRIIQFLDERGMSFSFCLNKNETLVLCGWNLLCQNLHSKEGNSKLVNDDHQLVSMVVSCLEAAQAPMAGDFREVAASMMSMLENPNAMSAAELPSSPSGRGELFHQTSTRPLEKGIDFSSRQNHPRVVFPTQVIHAMGNRSYSGRLSLDSARADLSLRGQDFRSPVSVHRTSSVNSRFSPSPQPCQNLNYLSLQDGSSASSGKLRPVHSISSRKPNSQLASPSIASVSSSGNMNPSPISPTEWELIYSPLGRGQSSIFNTVYSSPTNLGPHPLQAEWAEIPASGPTTITNPSFSGYSGNWAPEQWNMVTPNMQGMHCFEVRPQDNLNLSSQSALNANKDGLNSSNDGSEFAATSDPGGADARQSIDYQHTLLNGTVNGNDFVLEGLDGLNSRFHST